MDMYIFRCFINVTKVEIILLETFKESILTFLFAIHAFDYMRDIKAGFTCKYYLVLELLGKIIRTKQYLR